MREPGGCEELAPRPLPSPRKPTPAWETIGNGSVSFKGLFSLLPSHPAVVGTGSQGWSLRTRAQHPSLYARWAVGSGQGSAPPPTPQGQSEVSHGLSPSHRCANIPRKEHQTARTTLAHHSFIQQPCRPPPGQVLCWELAVGPNTSQMDGHVRGEAGLLTHFFFHNMNI